MRNSFNKLHHFSPSRAADESVFSAWSEKGVKTGWQEPDPRVVVVNTEHAWIPDPWSDGAHQLWDNVTEDLTKAGWGNVHWDSINAAIHIVYIHTPDPWSSILTKRALEKSS